jgi:hypothetical protein
MAAPEFDKGTVARTLIGPCGQVTGLPDRRQAYGPSAPCQIPALSALSRLRPSRKPLAVTAAMQVSRRLIIAYLCASCMLPMIRLPSLSCLIRTEAFLPE